MNKPIIKRLPLILAVLCTFILIGCEDKSKIREEIKSVESQIIKIDKAISYLIEQKRETNTPAITVYPEDRSYSGRIVDHALQELLNEPTMIQNRRIDAQINELKSRREILMVRLKTLMEKL